MGRKGDQPDWSEIGRALAARVGDIPTQARQRPVGPVIGMKPERARLSFDAELMVSQIVVERFGPTRRIRRE